MLRQKAPVIFCICFISYSFLLRCVDVIKPEGEVGNKGLKQQSHFNHCHCPVYGEVLQISINSRAWIRIWDDGLHHLLQMEELKPSISRFVSAAEHYLSSRE